MPADKLGSRWRVPIVVPVSTRWLPPKCSVFRPEIVIRDVAHRSGKPCRFLQRTNQSVKKPRQARALARSVQLRNAIIAIPVRLTALEPWMTTARRRMLGPRPSSQHARP